MPNKDGPGHWSLGPGGAPTPTHPRVTDAKQATAFIAFVPFVRTDQSDIAAQSENRGFRGFSSETACGF
ncbi:hypothetical protein Pan14r_21440 [Crateriforma conspicua]|uniref:Uncharacterized protein n=1 Tax=Crateriforma conspicua TaxID=2527996 RepID=A0A5C5Y4G2_9PLAN|nr:hypothetical protein Pan14r_21440 [Crateriforma conspicua]